MARGGKGKGPGTWQSSAAYQIALNRIVAARNEAGMTQRQVAESLGKPASWIAKIESKERRLDIVEFIAIARALRIKEGDLLRSISADLPRRLEI
jgi:transcriptional regulator with XRE-family HTH domain